MVKEQLIYSSWSPNEKSKLGGSIPFPQGKSYLKYKTDTTNRLQHRSQMLEDTNGYSRENMFIGQNSIKTTMNANQELIEGFDGMVGPSAATEKTAKEFKELREYEGEYNKKLSAYALAHKNLMDTTQTFVSVTGTQKDNNSYGNQNVQLTGTDGNTYKGYVTSRGFYKPYESDDVLNANLGKNGCPADITTIDGSYPISDLNQGNTIDTKPELFYLKDSPMISGQACGNEATNVQVTHMMDTDLIGYKDAPSPACYIDKDTMDKQDDISYPGSAVDITTLKDQCSVRAADLGKPFFGINGGKTSTCYTTDALPSSDDIASESVQLYEFPKNSYLQKYSGSIVGGLLPTGKLGVGFWDNSKGKLVIKHSVKPKEFSLTGSINTPWTLDGAPEDINNSTTFQCGSNHGGIMKDIDSTYGSYSKNQRNENCPCGAGYTGSVGDCTKCTDDDDAGDDDDDTVTTTNVFGGEKK